MSVMDHDEQERFAHTQRLKAAIHYTVGKICEELAEEEGVQFSLQFISALSETTYRQCITMGEDLEQFARHAKRNTVHPDDVKLLVRKSPPLHEYISEMAAKLQTAAAKNKKPRKKRTTKAGDSTATETVADNDEDSNM